MKKLIDRERPDFKGFADIEITYDLQNDIGYGEVHVNLAAPPSPPTDKEVTA